ncbi:hypothetical protein BAUCODRAFT_435846 [Baudoinia panamericana UAMH 10762]|uniref:methionyl-tRNA formyltransferase n=1 Tax=Baudoinia panamericana (strain UAMH 10762) TaxID=717646 RepID=M2MZJ3_BAUPA|nr:uncharacterized protein BAUCODRAFT_435846 [Baudoinia panamericana UAMH 10762]EMC97023.1 hypothetical protein BAUCODRAFT_435846 [Baudoinia panamericana UAMH 10762]
MLLRSLRVQYAHRAWWRYNTPACARSFSDHGGRVNEALKILFCGADDLSIKSLGALSELQQSSTGLIESIDVVCRPDKPRGRGLKVKHEVPIKAAAFRRGLQLHQLDTFTGWSPPKDYDLVVAVSFGLLVPGRLLTAAKYGGLNVHPSLLPEFRGAAPIPRALLSGCTVSGVTLQTMHPTRFDHGTILAQEEMSLDPLPSNGEKSILDNAIERMGTVGARMLSDYIRHRRYEHPAPAFNLKPRQPSNAPKITPEDRHIDWNTWTADKILLRDRVLGKLWDTVTFGKCMWPREKIPQPKRMVFHGPWTIMKSGREMIEVNPGQPLAVSQNGNAAPTLGLHTKDGKVVMPSDVTIEGKKAGTGLRGLVGAVVENTNTCIASVNSRT